MGETVFFGYDQAALDREYNNSGKVANAAEYLARYPGESARTRDELPARLDLRYGPAPGETLDLFLPDGGGPAPVHVFVHGGYWRALGKADFSFVARGLQPAGVLVAVIDYALIPTVDMDELVRQVRASVAWLHRNAAAFGGDPGRITVSGHSAGGHLAAMLMSTDWAPLRRASARRRQGGVRHQRPLRPRADPALVPERDARAHGRRRRAGTARSTSSRPGRAVRSCSPSGELEGDEYHRQTESLAAAWRRRGLVAEVMDMAGHDHFSIVTELGKPGHAAQPRDPPPDGAARGRSRDWPRR